MSGWQWSSRIQHRHAIAVVTMVTSLTLATVAMGCPTSCQCTQPFYVYCQKLGLRSEDLPDVLTSVPGEAVLLDLSCNSVDRLTSGLLDSMANLEYLFLPDNQVQVMGRSVFHYQQRLKELNLRNNCLTEISTSVFVNLPNLKKLHLDGNHISRIQDRALFLPNLRQLHLQRNKLTSLAPLHFSGLTDLQHLDLSDNQIRTLEVGTFQDLSHLQRLRLSKNQLSSLAENVFQGLSSLKELYLDGNMLPSLDCFDVPIFASTLQHLMLTDNSLAAVPHNVFSKLQSLRTLALDHNEISVVGQQAFKGLQLDNLTLTHNFLEIIERDMFDGVRGISWLDLSHNRIHTIKTGAFDNFRESVYVLDLASNQLGTLDRGMFRGMRNLQTLNLSSNAIWSILDGSFRELTQLTDLDLNRNQLQWLSAGLLEGPSLQRLSILDNPVRELRGFRFEYTNHPVSILVNLTLESATTSSLTVTWPYRHGSHLYWKVQVWCLATSEGDSALCDKPLAESSIPPYRVSETITDLRHGQDYFVCVNPAFLAKDVTVCQCGAVSTALDPKATVKPESQGSQATANSGCVLKGDNIVLYTCVVLLTVHVFVNLFWMDVRVQTRISWTIPKTL